MPRERYFDITRRDMDGYESAVGIQLEPEHGVEVDGKTFDEAKAALVDHLRTLLASALALEEPTP